MIRLLDKHNGVRLEAEGWLDTQLLDDFLRVLRRDRHDDG